MNVHELEKYVDQASSIVQNLHAELQSRIAVMRQLVLDSLSKAQEVCRQLLSILKNFLVIVDKSDAYRKRFLEIYDEVNTVLIDLSASMQTLETTKTIEAIADTVRTLAEAMKKLDSAIWSLKCQVHDLTEFIKFLSSTVTTSQETH